MIIRQVELRDFGIYKGQHVFDLTPIPLNGFRRPVVLFSGKNGAGKTTFVEAIRLCLHGSLAISGRVSRTSYKGYLAKHIHVPLDSANRPTSAKIAVEFDYVRVGRKQVYRVERSWSLARERVREHLQIWQDGRATTDLATTEQKESFLRELVPSQVADVFFFDGEKLQLLAEDGTSSRLLARTVKRLFGLDLVEQLQKDLDIYLSRKGDSPNNSLQAELHDVVQRITTLEGRLTDLRLEEQENRVAIADIQRAISEQEQRIASQGKWFAQRLEDARDRRQRLEVEIDMRRREAQDMCSGLVPFSVAPDMCRRVASRLHLENEYAQLATSRRIVTKQVEQVHGQMMSSEFWADVGVTADEPARLRVLEKIESTLTETIPTSDVSSHEVILQVSDRERQTLLDWTTQALKEVPQRFCNVVERLNLLETRLKEVDQELAMVPSDAALEPLVHELHSYSQDLGRLRKTGDDLTEQIRRAEYELEQRHYEQRRVRQQIAQREHDDQRIQLAARTQLLLEEYAQELRREKIELLEESLALRFNDLSRKRPFVDAVSIDPDTFEITLYRQRQAFERGQLSAGERQILAVATIWALREVSGVPMPVIIDTPLGRLDSDHRLKMVEDYFPRASHQTVLLATDTELDTEMLAILAPAVSRVYELSYDPVEGKTEVDVSAALFTSTLEESIAS